MIGRLCDFMHKLSIVARIKSEITQTFRNTHLKTNIYEIQQIYLRSRETAFLVYKDERFYKLQVSLSSSLIFSIFAHSNYMAT